MANSTARKIIEQAKRLTARDRKRVVSALEASLAGRQGGPRVRARADAYEALLALTGTAHSDVKDVSSDKYAHVAAAYADET